MKKVIKQDNNSKPADVQIEISNGEGQGQEETKEINDKPFNQAIRESYEKKIFINETEKVKVVYDNVTNLTTDILKDITETSRINIDKVQAAVTSLVDNVLKHTDTMITLAKVKKFDDYTFKHSVNVAVLAIAFGKHLNYSKKELETLGAGGILHDCGKMKIPVEILNKPGKLTKDEFEIMKDHPLKGAELISSTQFDRKSILMVLQHHEKYSGGGYPTGLPGNRISTFGMMTAIADVYDALTSERVYKKALTPFEGLKIVYQGKGNHFHPNMVEHFINAMGLFPIGSVVRLKNQIVGIVISVNRKNLLYPRVLIIADDKNNMVASPYIVNIDPPSSEESNEWTMEEILEASEESEPSKPSNKSEESKVDRAVDPAGLNIDIAYYMGNLNEFSKKAA